MNISLPFGLQLTRHQEAEPEPAAAVQDERLLFTPSHLYPTGFVAKWEDLSPGSFGWQRIDQMLRDEQVKSAIWLKKLAVIASGWSIHASDSDNDAALESADAVKNMLVQLPGSFNNKLTQILDAIPYGFTVTEKVLEFKDGLVSIKKLKTVRSHDIRFVVDEFGNMLIVVQDITRSFGSGAGSGVVIKTLDGKSIDFITRQPVADARGIAIEPDRLIHFTFNETAGDPRGRTDLVEAYRSWWSKDNLIKFWNIDLERFAMPMRWAEYEGLTDAQLSALKSFMDNARLNNSLTTPKDKVIFHQIERSGGGKTNPFKEALEWHDKAIARSILMPGKLGLTPEDKVGGFAQSKTHFDIFMLIVSWIKENLEAVINEQLIQPVSRLNWQQELWPVFRMNPLTEDDKFELFKMWTEGVKGKVLTQTFEDERHLRKLSGFPELSEESFEEGKAERATQVAVPASFQLADEDIKRMDAEEQKRTDEGVNSLVDLIMGQVKSYEAAVNKLDQEEAAAFRQNAGFMRSLQSSVKATLLDSARAGVKDFRTELKPTSDMMQFQELETVVTSDEVLAFISGKSFAVAGRIADDLTKAVQNTITSKFSSGLSNKETVDLLKTNLLPFVGGGIIGDDTITASRLFTTVRTISTDAVNAARMQQANDPEISEQIFGLQYDAVLDDRTTDICRHLNGRIFEKDDPELVAFRPPNHFACRSILSPITIDDPEKKKGFISDKQKDKGIELTPDGFGKVEAEVLKLKSYKAEYRIFKSDAKNVLNKKNRDAIERQHRFQREDGPPLEDWEYLLHHIHEKDGKEIIHHCKLVDHLGNLYLIDHIENKKGQIIHAIIGVDDKQEIIWSDEEAKEIGLEVPCPGRQL